MAKQIYPEPTVGALIFNEEGKLFLMKSHKWNGRYVIPGGHIELGETITEALKREIKEETNLDIYDIEFLMFQEFIYDQIFWEKKHFIFFDFSCKTKNNDVKLNSEAQEYIWISLKELKEIDIDPYIKTAIEEYKKKK